MYVRAVVAASPPSGDLRCAPGPRPSGLQLDAASTRRRRRDRRSDDLTAWLPPDLPSRPRARSCGACAGMIRRTATSPVGEEPRSSSPPMVFSKHLDGPVGHHERALGAFGIFCLLAGAVYTLNDLVDVDGRPRHTQSSASGPSRRAESPCPLAKAMVVAAGPRRARRVPPGRRVVHLRSSLAYFVQNVAYSFRAQERRVPRRRLHRPRASCCASSPAASPRKTPVSGYMMGCTAPARAVPRLRQAPARARFRRHPPQRRSSAAALERLQPRRAQCGSGITGLATVANYLAYTLDPNTQAFFKNAVALAHHHPPDLRRGPLPAARGRPAQVRVTHAQEILRDVRPSSSTSSCGYWRSIFILYQLRQTAMP